MTETKATKRRRVDSDSESGSDDNDSDGDDHGAPGAPVMDKLSTALYRLVLSFEGFKQQAKQRRISKTWKVVIDDNPDLKEVDKFLERTLVKYGSAEDISAVLLAKSGKTAEEIDNLDHRGRKELFTQVIGDRKERLAFARALVDRSARQDAEAKDAMDKLSSWATYIVPVKWTVYYVNRTSETTAAELELFGKNPLTPTLKHGGWPGYRMEMTRVQGDALKWRYTVPFRDNPHDVNEQVVEMTGEDLKRVHKRS